MGPPSSVVAEVASTASVRSVEPELPFVLVSPALLTVVPVGMVVRVVVAAFVVAEVAAGPVVAEPWAVADEPAAGGRLDEPGEVDRGRVEDDELGFGLGFGLLEVELGLGFGAAGGGTDGAPPDPKAKPITLPGAGWWLPAPMLE